MTRFPRPARRTGRADLPHPAPGLVSRRGIRGCPRTTLPPCPSLGDLVAFPLGLGVELLRQGPDSRAFSGSWPITHPLLLPKHPEPGPLPSTGITRLRQYYGPLRVPHRPAPKEQLRASDSRTVWASRVATRSFSTCHPHYPGEPPGARSVVPPRVLRPSPLCRRVGARNFTFEACSGFTRVTARGFASSPFENCCPGGLATSGYPNTARP